jgi:protein-L-isoaspartate(D-aspartate) O-methyltransferase
MGANIFTIERQKKIFEQNKEFIFRKKYPNIRFFYGDGFEGLPTFAPFDKILITAAAPFIPPKLVQQLKRGGKMVLPLDDDGIQKMMRITKNEDGSYEEQTFSNFSFVPMLKGRN